MKTQLDDLGVDGYIQRAKAVREALAMDDLGIAPLSISAFANRKSRWRRSARRVLRALDDLIAASNKGRHIPMGDIYVMARGIVDLGRRGLVLRDEMPQELRRPSQPAKSIAGICVILESMSQVLRDLAIRQNTPLVDFPMFVNKLSAINVDIDTGALNALDAMRRGVGE